MMEKKKKRLIIFSCLAGTLILLVLLSSAIFQIKSVSVEYQTTLTLLSVNELNEMVDEADIPLGKSIFFSSLDENQSQMEKEHPYVKVNKIERKFPNSLVVLVSERVPVARVLAENGKYYIVDADLKILNIVDGDTGYNSQTGEKDLPLFIDESGAFNRELVFYEIGDFVKNDQVKGYIDAIYRGAVTTGSEDGSVAISLLHTMNEIRFNYSRSLEKMCFNITYKDSDIKTRIIGDNNLVDDLYKVINIVSSGGKYKEVNCTNGVVYAKK